MTKFRPLLAVLACGVIVATACGSDSNSSSTTAAATATTAASTATTAAASATTAASGGTAAASETTAAAGGDGVAAAKAVVEQYSKADAGIGVTIPLTGKPEKKTFAWMECDVPTCASYLTPGIKDATAALGWDLKIIPMKSTDPGPAIQQAIDAGVDYISLTGVPVAAFQAQADAAKAKGIPILSCFATDAPSEESNILMQCGDESFVKKTGPIMADWAIADSNGAANVLIVTIRDFPVLVSEEDAYKAELAKNCPDCKVDTLNVTLDDLIGGKVPAAVASKLQTDSGINYVFNTFGDLPAGLTAALKSAGLDKQVTVYGQDFSKFDLDEIVAGTMGSWSADPKGYAGWLMVDAAARLSLGMKLEEERQAASLPTIIVSDAPFAQEISDAGGDWFPPGSQDAFKKLWGV
ncbi:MAG TPA: substrate-binding domain-containing protein [Ilumatobacteraceae bacterium]|jgi:ribose transport system substrate-binding protein